MLTYNGSGFGKAIKQYPSYFAIYSTIMLFFIQYKGPFSEKVQGGGTRFWRISSTPPIGVENLVSPPPIGVENLVSPPPYRGGEFGLPPPYRGGEFGCPPP